MPAEFVERGRAFLTRGDPQNAVKVCRLGLISNPHEVEGRLVLGNALLALKKYDEVLAEVHVALEQHPKNAKLLCLQGEAYMHKGNLESAQSSLAQAMRHDPSNAHSLKISNQLSRMKKSLGVQTGTIEIDPHIEGVQIRNKNFSDSIELVSDDMEIMEETNMTRTNSSHGSARPHFKPKSYLSGAEQDDFDDQQPTRLAENPMSAPKGLDELDALFPEEERGVSQLAVIDPSGQISKPHNESAPVPKKSSPTADMRLIRNAIQVEDAAPPPRLETQLPSQPSVFPGAPISPPKQKISPPPSGSKKTKRPKNRSVSKRKRWILPVYGGLLMASIAAGVYGGLAFRDYRMSTSFAQAHGDAQALASLGDYQSALKAWEVFDQMQSVGDRSDTVALYKLKFAVEHGEKDSNLDSLISSADVASPSKHVIDGYNSLYKGNYDDAESSAKLSISADPTDFEAYELLGQAQLALGHVEESRVSFEKSLSQRKRISTQLKLVEALGELEDFEQSNTLLDTIEATIPDHSMAKVLRAQLWVKSSSPLPESMDVDDALSTMIDSVGHSDQAQLSKSQGAWAAITLGELKMMRGDKESAKTALERATSLLIESNAPMVKALATAYLNLGDTESAEKLLNAGLQRWPQMSAFGLAAAQHALSRGDPTQALSILDSLKLDPSNVDAQVLAGLAKVELGDVENALGIFDRVLAKNPKQIEALTARVRIDRLLGEFQSGLDRFNALDLDIKKHPTLAIEKAMLFQMAGQVDNAKALLAPLYKSTNDVDVLVQMASIEVSAGDFESANSVLATILEKQPSHVKANGLKAQLELDSGQTQRAFTRYQSLWAKQQSPEILIGYVRSATLSGQAELAAKLLEKNKQTITAVWQQQVERELGRIRLYRHDAAGASRWLKKSTPAGSNDLESFLLALDASGETRNGQWAQELNQSLDNDFKGSAWPSFAKGHVAMIKNLASEAVAHFSEAQSLLKQSGINPRYQSTIHYWLGRAYEMNGDLDKAIAALNKSTSLNPDLNWAYFWLGQIYFQEEKKDLMMKYYQNAVDLDPGATPMAWFFMGYEHKERSEDRKAIHAFQQFLVFWNDSNDDMAIEAKTVLSDLLNAK